ncbi:M20 family peptidase [Caulobacter sp. NIBR1757]|uniref:M20 family peptidase n=1 Tax=Caulobacter sp. NIBR1757 TaxID=3016000 RepID=UPI0022F05EF5|nr:M20 family peptidase [Caulobacter sp. NIBR1757]WGM37955.1 Succinyl-diaminopimelate desuccinylase [Caulobacter sp. NIBR1757]
MKLFGKIALGAVAVVVALGAVVVVRTLTFKPPAAVDISAVTLAAAPPIDQASAAQHLSQAVRIRTVSNQNKADNQWAEWDRLHAWLAATYPAAHAAMTREILPNKALVYTWPGSDKALKPIVLMAHQDVVPITPGTEKDWKHDPFGGEIAEGAVWGRGSIDDKGSLVAIFEGLEALAKSGFQPKRTVIIVSGQDEEAGGAGARAAAALLKSRGVQAEWVLDEGSAAINDHPITGKPAAVIGIAEKGYATLRVTAPASGGHSSAPPRETGVAVLAKAITAITDNQFPLELKGPGMQMVQTLGADSSFVTRMAIANPWLFGPILKKTFAKTGTGAALLHTTIAPTMLKGSPKENVLPQDATAWINYRIAPGQTPDDVMARAREATKGLKVELAWDRPPELPSPISSTTSEGWKLLSALASDGGKLPVAPGLVTAGTDSRYMSPLTSDIYRYQALLGSMNTFGMIHGTNEHMTVENLARMTTFYARLVASAAG